MHQKIKKNKLTEKFNIEDTDEIIEAEAERFLLLFKKAFHEYHGKSLKEENIDCEDSVVTDFLTKVAKTIRGHILPDVQGSKAAKFLKIIDSFFHQYLTTNKMARTRLGGPPRHVNNFENRRFAAAKEIANARRRDNRFKIKFLLPQGKNIDVKVRGNVVRKMRARRRSIFPGLCRNRQH